MRSTSFFGLRRKARNTSIESLDKADLGSLIAAADRARDNREFAKAAMLYEQATKLDDSRPELFVQLGNMRKDSDDVQLAYDAYVAALSWLKKNTPKGNLAPQPALAALADVYCQLGHLFKLAGHRDRAVEYYRQAFQADPLELYLNEAKIAESVVNTIRINAMEIQIHPGLDAAPAAISDYDEFLITSGHVSSATRDQHRQCVCWSQNFSRRSSGRHFNRYTCKNCGTEIYDAVTVFNTLGKEVEFDALELSALDIQNLFDHLGVDPSSQRVAIVGATCIEPSAVMNNVSFLTSSNRAIISPGLLKCQYDVVVVWQISRRTTDIYRVADQAFAIARPNGLVCFTFDVAPKAQLDPTWQTRPHWSTNATSKEIEGGETGPWLRLCPKMFVRALRLVERDATEVARFTDGVGSAAIAVRKTTSMSIGVMSGIGDNVWSLLLAEAVQEKYQASSLTFVIHDSGDARRKRSNGMMARFEVVADMTADKFQVHANPAMDAQTGHLRYIPPGPVELASSDPFDYRLIVNSFLEHGLSLDRTCDHLELDKALIDYDFFQKYSSLERDDIALAKVKELAGDRYVVFYYGALIDNTDGGLNRGALWTANDWNDLGRKIHAEYGCKIVIIGAAYDLEYARLVQGQTSDVFYVNTIGQLDITETLAVINQSQFIVSFPAGVGIVAPYMRVPSTIFWRPKHLSYHVMHERAGFEPAFATNWVPPSVLDDGLYYPAWYSQDTPDTVFSVIRERQWYFRTPAKKIGAW